MAGCKNYVGNEGTRIKITIKECNEDGTEDVVDISTCLSKVINFKKPTASDPTEKEIVTKTAEFLTDGSDGVIYYDAEAGFLDVKGTYQAQGYVVFVDGKWYTTTISFSVSDPLSV